jgi:hypothetical protein
MRGESCTYTKQAKATITMSDEEGSNIEGMINTTIERLEKSSSGSIQMGSKYSRLLKLLWRKKATVITPQRHKPSVHSIDSIITTTEVTDTIVPSQIYSLNDPMVFNNIGWVVDVSA